MFIRDNYQAIVLQKEIKNTAYVSGIFLAVSELRLPLSLRVENDGRMRELSRNALMLFCTNRNIAREVCCTHLDVCANLR